MPEVSPQPSPDFTPGSLRFDARGLIPAIAQSRDGEVLMMA